MPACEFCEIASGERDAHLVFEDGRAAAFLDRNPAIEGHTLVIPTAHHEFLFTDDAAIATAVFEAVRAVARAMERVLDPDGISLFYTSADLVGTVTHAHVHVLPRFAGDDIHLALSRGTLDDGDAARLTERLRAGV